jgi:hypothetical protein
VGGVGLEDYGFAGGAGVESFLDAGGVGLGFVGIGNRLMVVSGVEGG